ncbi:conjugal transfer protein [Thermoactinomyces sp. DSM 45892]|uniref:conjugal transfer protein n=1 Tax=Thermoactinomyces sp. DSM 45892 TaxID=1882753 RepID=UPI0008982E9A|nr:conjugal transfer protein [Thermoactinomyces sp. DSM 45892]SDY83010.1 Conjugative transposon protein TcpC [Thermoactinomyces sp. DSM 45892]
MSWKRKTRLAVTTTLLVSLVGLGIYRAVHPGPTAVQATNEKLPVFVDTSKGAENYGVYFVNYWLAGDLEGAKKYAASGFNVPSDRDIPKQKLEGTGPWGSRKLDDKTVAIIVRAKIEKGNAVFLEVPVMTDEGRYGVVGVPTFIPEPAPVVMKEKDSLETVQDSATQNQVKQVMDSFFRQYTSGKPVDLANLFIDGKQRKVLGMSNVVYESLDSVQIGKPENDRLIAKATAKLKYDTQVIPQPFTFTFKRNGSSWQIEATNPYISTP